LKDKAVDEYINRFDGERNKILKKLRALISKTFPNIKEGMRYGVPWYGDKFYIVGLRDSVNMGFNVKWMAKKHAGELKGKGEYMRHLKFKTSKDVDTEKSKIVRIMKVTPKHSHKK
jgi:hypothetical protein